MLIIIIDVLMMVYIYWYPGLWTCGFLLWLCAVFGFIDSWRMTEEHRRRDGQERTRGGR